MLKNKQITDYILNLVKTGALTHHSPVPSINQISREFNVANETVVKAYKRLKEKGILYSLKGKGFYIAKVDLSIEHSIFVLFDTFSAYKETLYNAMLKKFDKRASLDLYFHHYNFRIFESLIKESKGKYTEYIILSHLDSDVGPVLKLLPKEKLFIIDGYINNINMKGIYQDFENDVFEALSAVESQAKKYKNFYFIYKKKEYPNVISQIKSGFIHFCEKTDLKPFIMEGDELPEMKKGDAYLVLDDEHLVELAITARDKGLKPGHDIGIVSYNETALKKIAMGGISVISTDFAAMGEGIADMILQNRNECIKNPGAFIDRGSF